ncbi:MAG: hypothetical protein HY736_18345 [Verrucomicrobia bacterium]|nr:hypothetical protein [Verrucomicrobiota bacterium]
MPADRLAELLRQRALLQEHLAWLDREIVDASPRTTPRDSSPPPPLPAPAPLDTASAAREPVLPEAAPPAAVLAPDAIIEEYRVAPDALRTDVRKGCFLYFAAAFAVLILGVMAMYFALRRP